MTDGDLVRAGRTVTAMTTGTDDQRMVEEFMAGTDVPTIAARYAVPEEYVDRVIEQASYAKPKRWDFSWNRWPNRLSYSLLAALAINAITHTGLGWIIGIVLFVLTSAITARR